VEERKKAAQRRVRSFGSIVWGKMVAKIMGKGTWEHPPVQWDVSVSRKAREKYTHGVVLTRGKVRKWAVFKGVCDGADTA
jgi:hypothetical protein